MVRKVLSLIILSFLLLWQGVWAASQSVHAKKRQVEGRATLAITKKTVTHHALQVVSSTGLKKAKVAMVKMKSTKRSPVDPYPVTHINLATATMHHATTKMAFNKAHTVLTAKHSYYAAKIGPTLLAKLSAKSTPLHQFSQNTRVVATYSNNFGQPLASCLSRNSNILANNFNSMLNQRLMDYRSSVCATAEAQLGKPYHFGVENPGSGFDCSGLSQFVYAKAGIQIPRTALGQYHDLAPVQHLQEGDLVFFRIAGNREVSHVGIYIGGGYFVHSPRPGEAIRVDRLANPYWHEHYAGARRVLTSSKLAEAGPLLTSFGMVREAS